MTSSPNARGAVIMVVGCAFLTLSDTASKWETEFYPVSQVIFGRSFFSAAFILALACSTAQGRRTLRINRPGAQLLLASFSVSATALFVAALHALPLADATALNLVGPLLVVALAPYALRERVNLRLWVVVLCGFVGVLIMLQPGTGAFRWAALLPLGSALSGALRDLTTRRLHISESSMSMLLVSSLLLILISPAIPSSSWRSIELTDMGMLALAGAALAVANYCLIRALQLANASFVIPLRYSTIIWAIPFGAAVWHEQPSPTVLIGSLILIACGTHLLRIARGGNASPKSAAANEPTENARVDVKLGPSQL